MMDAVTYHIHVPTLAKVQAVVPFDIDVTDPRTAAWYLLGAVYGRETPHTWEDADAQRGVNWNALGAACIHAPAIVDIALSLSGEVVYGTESYDLMQSVAMLSTEQMPDFLTAALLFQHIKDGTWEPTKQALLARKQEQEEAQREELGLAPEQPVEYDDSSPRHDL